MRDEGLLLFIFILFIVVNVSNTLLTSNLWRSVDYLSQTVVVVSSTGYGTGWWVDRKHIVTAYHVIDTAADIRALRGRWLSPCTAVYTDTANDVAVLRVDNPPPWAEGLPLSSDLRLGDRVLVVGYPIQLYFELGGNITEMSAAPRVASGTISWISPTHPVAEIDVATDAGNSGGPVLKDEVGAVVGMIVYARKGVVSEGFYILRADAIALALKEAGIDYKVRYDLRPMLAGVGLAALVIGVLAVALLGGRRVATA